MTNIAEPIPVVLFAYARPAHLQRVLECLRVDRVPLLYVFADAASTPAVAGRVAETRALLHAIDWCEVRLVERRQNFGLGRSVISGVSEVAARHDAFIVWEDDLVCVRGTYDWVCAALREFADEPRVMSVTPWTHPRTTPADIGDSPYFDGRAESWVWGSWRRSWRGMAEEDALSKLCSARERGVAPEAYGHDLPLMAQQELRKNIWAVRWIYHHLQHGGLCLRPPHSMVEHIGFDAQATHAASAQRWANLPLQPAPAIPAVWPAAIEHPAVCELWRLSQPCAPWTTHALSRVLDVLAPGARGAGAKRIAKRLVPARLRKLGRRWFGWRWFEGNFANWQTARALCDGYDDAAIVERVVGATRQVRAGLAAFERDGLLFSTPSPEPGLIAAFRTVASRTDHALRVLDFGGSLGTTYWRHHATWKDLGIARWDVVEQQKFVAAGRAEAEDGTLHFFESVAAANKASGHDVILASGCLQYLENPRATVGAWIQEGWTWILLNNLPLHDARADRLAIQRVPPDLYRASYPVWFFNRDGFLKLFGDAYEVAAEFSSEAVWPVGWKEYRSTGLLLRKRNGS